MIPTSGPVVVVIAGSNGAGKSTFFESYLASAGLRFVNADVISRELGLDAYTAAEVAARFREELVSRGESFIFETVLSDPVGEKVAQFVEWQARGYTVVFCFIGLASAALSDQRVAMRVSQGGHDVPWEKIETRYPRTLANLALALGQLSQVRVYDNSDLRQPYRRLAIYEHGALVEVASGLPTWFAEVVRRAGKMGA